MNFQTLLSFAIALGVLVIGVQSSGSFTTFLNFQAILIVFGGTFAAISLSFQFDRLFLLLKIFIQNVLGKEQIDQKKVVRELLEFSKQFRAAGESIEFKATDPFLADAIALVQEGTLNDEELLDSLNARVATLYYQQTEEVAKFRTIAKYPPAFGLLGTTLSMIRLLQKLGDPGAQRSIGVEMSLGLIATFYGLVLANLVFNPVAENLADHTRRIRYKNLMIIEGLRLIFGGAGTLVLAERMNLLVSSPVKFSRREDKDAIRSLVSSDYSADREAA